MKNLILNFDIDKLNLINERLCLHIKSLRNDEWIGSLFDLGLGSGRFRKSKLKKISKEN